MSIFRAPVQCGADTDGPAAGAGQDPQELHPREEVGHCVRPRPRPCQGTVCQLSLDRNNKNN